MFSTCVIVEDAKQSESTKMRDYLKAVYDHIPKGSLEDFHKELESIDDKASETLQLIKKSYQYIIKSKGFERIKSSIVSSRIYDRFYLSRDEAEAIALYTFEPKDSNIKFAESVNKILITQDDALHNICGYMYTLVSGLRHLPECKAPEGLYMTFNKKGSNISSYKSGSTFMCPGFAFATRTEQNCYVQGDDYNDLVIVKIQGRFRGYDVSEFSYSEDKDPLSINRKDSVKALDEMNTNSK